MDNFEKYTFLLTKNKDFQKLFYAKFITYMGDWFLTVPLLSIIYELTNSPLITSIVLVVQSAPYVILGSFGGYLADKFDRKVVIAVSEFLSGCAVLLIMYSVSTENVLFILISFSFLGVVNCAYMPASDAALPNVVLRENLPEANVLNFSTWGIAAGLGAGLGGFLSEFLSRNQLFTINFLSFMFSAFLVFLIKTNLNENSGNVDNTNRVKFRDGLNFVLSDKKIFYLTVTKGMFGISAAGLLSLFTILSLDIYNTGDFGAGLMWSARGVGAFIGPVMFRYFFGKTDQKLLSTIGPCIMIWGIFYFLITFSSSLYITTLLLVLGHCGGGAQWAFSSYGIQILTPDNIRGRIAGLDYSFYFLMFTNSNLIIGYLATQYDVLTLFKIFPTLGFSVGLFWFIRTRSFWKTIES